jgi:hypothetical protein
MVLLGRRLTVDKAANRLQISHGSAYETIFYFYLNKGSIFNEDNYSRTYLQ